MEALDENENWGISRLCIFPGSYRFLVRLRTITREIIGAVNRHSFAIGRERPRESWQANQLHVSMMERQV